MRTPKRKQGKPPFLFVNMAMTADGKIATANRAVSTFGSPRDQENLMLLRTRADALMAGARTADLKPVTLGPGNAKYRRMRQRNGLTEYNLRVIVSRSGSVNPEAELFKHRFAPIIILTTRAAGARRLARLRQVADDVHICGEREICFRRALAWLARKWKVRRLLCEGGGELNDALFREGLVNELHLTICPLIFGGRTAPTISDATGVSKLSDAIQLRQRTSKRCGAELFLVFDVLPRADK